MAAGTVLHEDAIAFTVMLLRLRLGRGWLFDYLRGGWSDPREGGHRGQDNKNKKEVLRIIGHFPFHVGKRNR
jgi:hypothetical protein